MKLGRDFHAGLLIAAFFRPGLVCPDTEPCEGSVPSFGFVPTRKPWWPRAFAIVGLAMGLLATVFEKWATGAEKPADAFEKIDGHGTDAQRHPSSDGDGIWWLRLAVPKSFRRIRSFFWPFCSP